MPRGPKRKSGTPTNSSKEASSKRSEKAPKKAEKQTPSEDVSERLVLAPHSKVDWNQNTYFMKVFKATSELKKYADKPDPEQKASLFEEDKRFFLTLVLNTVPEKRKAKPIVLTVPCPFVKPDVEICLLVKTKEDKQTIKWKELPNVAKVIYLDSLRDICGRYEARRNLAASYDIFMCDDRLQLVLPNLLGKSFRQKTKVPIPIKVTGSKLAQRIEKARDASILHIPTGSTLSIAIGSSTQTADEVTKNIAAVLDKIIDKLPKQWDGIASVGLRVEDGIVLPFYKNVKVVAQKKGRSQKQAKDEKESTPKDTKKETKNEPRKAEPKKQEAIVTPTKVATKAKESPKQPAARKGAPKTQQPKQNTKQEGKKVDTKQKKPEAKETAATKQTPTKSGKPEQSPKAKQPKKPEAKETPVTKQTPPKSGKPEQSLKAEQQKTKGSPNQKQHKKPEAKKEEAVAPKTGKSEQSPKAKQPKKPEAKETAVIKQTPPKSGKPEQSLKAEQQTKETPKRKRQNQKGDEPAVKKAKKDNKGGKRRQSK